MKGCGPEEVLTAIVQRWVDVLTMADWMPVLETIIGAMGKVGDDTALSETISIFCRACSVSDALPGMRGPRGVAILLRAADRCGQHDREPSHWLIAIARMLHRCMSSAATSVDERHIRSLMASLSRVLDGAGPGHASTRAAQAAAALAARHGLAAPPQPAADAQGKARRRKIHGGEYVEPSSGESSSSDSEGARHFIQRRPTSMGGASLAWVNREEQ